jgi:TolA-binding protein
MKIGNFATTALFSLGALVCIAAQAQPAGGPAAGGAAEQKAGPGPGQERPNFEAIKADIIKGHQARIQVLQQSLTCMQGAKDQAAMRTCRQNERQAMQQLQDQRGGRRGGPPAGGPGPQGGAPRQ